MIEKDPTLPEAELQETLKAQSSNSKVWTASENQKFLEAYELWGWDYSAISQHIGSKSNDQVHNKRHLLLINMKNKPELAMSDFLYTNSKVKRSGIEWTESEKQKFNDAVREVGNKPYQISSIVGTRTYRQVSGRIGKIR